MTEILSALNHLSISALNQLLNDTLEQCFPEITFIGEISEIKLASSGHAYMTIKDEQSSAAIILWRSHYSNLNFNPKVGDRVVCAGKPNIYPRTGRLQIIVHAMQLEGVGDLQRKFLLLKTKLAAEGLFDPSRKRRIPFMPSTIGIVSSASGAVIQDILVRIKARMPSTKILLVDTAVQGREAAKQIVEAIRTLNQEENVEVIILARGGGSLEDLWCFNEEIVAREIFASKKPVISAIGHETDYTIADLVADLRAPTPTAAAEMLIPDRLELFKQLDFLEHRLGGVQNWIMNLSQGLDDFESTLDNKFAEVFQNLNHKINTAILRLEQLKPINFAHSREVLDNWHNKLYSVLKNILSINATKLDLLEQKSIFLNPRNILKLGYAAIYQSGTRVNLAAEIKSGKDLRIEFYDDSILVEKVDGKR